MLLHSENLQLRARLDEALNRLAMFEQYNGQTLNETIDAQVQLTQAKARIYELENQAGFIHK